MYFPQRLRDPSLPIDEKKDLSAKNLGRWSLGDANFEDDENFANLRGTLKFESDLSFAVDNPDISKYLNVRDAVFVMKKMGERANRVISPPETEFTETRTKLGDKVLNWTWIDGKQYSRQITFDYQEEAAAAKERERLDAEEKKTKMESAVDAERKRLNETLQRIEREKLEKAAFDEAVARSKREYAQQTVSDSKMVISDPSMIDPTADLAAAMAGNGKGGAARPYTFHEKWTDFTTLNGLTENSETIEIWFQMCYLSKKKLDSLIVPAVGNAKNIVEGKMMDMKSIAGMTGYADNYPAKLHETAMMLSRGFMTRLFELVACQQVRQLNERNLENYYASKDINITIMKVQKVIQWGAGLMPRISDKVREDKKGEAFILYHTSAQSTGGLLKRMVSTLGDDARKIFKFTARDAGAVEAVIDNPTSTTIPMILSVRVMMTLMSFLEVFEILPPKYYFGMRQSASFPPAVFDKLKAVMKRYRELKTQVTEIRGMSLDELADMV